MKIKLYEFGITCSIRDVGGNMSWTSVAKEVYDFTSIRRLMATSPCQKNEKIAINKWKVECLFATICEP